MDLPSSLILGVKVSVVIAVKCSSFKLHTSTPSADPAAMAAPRAVVSGIDGRTVKQGFNSQYLK